MKHLLGAFITSLCLSTQILAQDTLVTYYNDEWDKVKSKSEATHYRHSFEVDKGIYAFKSYYMTGELKAEGFYKKKNYKKFNGNFISYYINGVKSSEGQFNSDLKSGQWSYWFESGVLMNETQYNLEGEKHGRYINWYEDTSIDIEGQFTNDEMSGDWKYYFENGQLASREFYNNKVLEQFQYWNENGQPLTGEDLKIYQHIEYHTGSKGISDYIKGNFHYPDKARSLGIQGKVNIIFTVEKTGELSNIEFTGHKNEELREEARRLAKGLSKWIPAKWHNRLIQSTYTVPIIFKIN